jgi:parvulin-like peptidyl-prolyl isomerase
MRFRFCTAGLALLGMLTANAQVASHAPTAITKALSGRTASPKPGIQTTGKVVARVNGAVLTDRDLLREMYSIFPYAQQHNGFPKELEPEIRKGALEMIIFDELVYQEAVRRKVVIPQSQIASAESVLRKQFADPAAYNRFLKTEFGSQQMLDQKVRRSLLIEALLKREVGAPSKVSLAEAKAFYDQNPKQFQHGERLRIQTISIIPPENASLDVQKEARKRAEAALQQAKATKSYREFGLLAEKVSDDDWHVNMGDRKQVSGAQLPPPVVEAARKMKVGEVSELFQFGSNYTLFRLNGYTPAGKDEFSAVKDQIISELQKAKYNKFRSELHARLRKNAKVEVL